MTAVIDKMIQNGEVLYTFGQLDEKIQQEAYELWIEFYSPDVEWREEFEYCAEENDWKEEGYSIDYSDWYGAFGDRNEYFSFSASVDVRKFMSDIYTQREYPNLWYILDQYPDEEAQIILQRKTEHGCELREVYWSWLYNDSEEHQKAIAELREIANDVLADAETKCNLVAQHCTETHQYQYSMDNFLNCIFDDNTIFFNNEGYIVHV